MLTFWLVKYVRQTRYASNETVEYELLEVEGRGTVSASMAAQEFGAKKQLHLDEITSFEIAPLKTPESWDRFVTRPYEVMRADDE